MRRRQAGPLVLALYPFARGFAYVLFEGPYAPIEWAVKDIRGKERNALALAAIKGLIARLQPDILVLQDVRSDKPPKRSERIRRLHWLVAGHAQSEAIELHAYTRDDVRACFASAGAATRYEIAQVLASQLRALKLRLPPKQTKIWKSEDARMSLFDAAALAWTFYKQHAIEIDMGV